MKSDGASAIRLTDLETVLTTTRAVRKRLDTDRPVPREVLTECLTLALQAPTGGNAEDWRWILVGDPGVRERIGEHYRSCYQEFVLDPLQQDGATGPSTSGRLGGVNSDGSMSETMRKILDGADHLAKIVDQVPWLVVVCALRPNPEQGGPGTTAALYGSIFPAVWSFQLALRSRGLGSVLTTLPLNRPDELARILGIPEDATICAVLPVAHTLGTSFRQAPRRPLEEVAFIDAWGTPLTQEEP